MILTVRSLGAAEAVTWLVKSVLCVTIDVIIVEPLIAVVLVAVRWLPVPQDFVALHKVLGANVDNRSRLVDLITDTKLFKYEKIRKGTVKHAARRLRMLRNARRTVFDMVTFSLYTLVLMLVANGMFHSQSYLMTAEMENILVDTTDGEGIGLYDVSVI